MDVVTSIVMAHFTFFSPTPPSHGISVSRAPQTPPPLHLLLAVVEACFVVECFTFSLSPPSHDISVSRVPRTPPTASTTRGGGGAFRGGVLHLLADPNFARDLSIVRGPGEDTEAVTPNKETSGGHVVATEKEWKVSPGPESSRLLRQSTPMRRWWRTCHVKTSQRATEMEVAVAMAAIIEYEVESSCGRWIPEIAGLAMARDSCL
jgi:hypothetical protein